MDGGLRQTPRIIDESAGREACKHTSGGVFVSFENCFGAVVDMEEGPVRSVPGNEGRVADTLVDVRGVLRVFCRVLFGTQTDTEA